MKKLIILACLIALALPMVSQAQTTKPIKGWGFVGGQYTKAVTGEDGGLASLGFFTNVTGPLYTAARVDVGHYGVVNTDWVLLTRVQESPLYVGLIGGLDGTFKPDSSATLMTYLNAASGIMASVQTDWKFLGFSNPNFTAVAKYHFAFEGGTAFVDGWTAGVYVALPWY